MSIQGREIYDKERISINVARIRKAGRDFEVVVDADQAIAFRNGSHIELRDILKSKEIFADAKKGELAPESSFEGLFGTTDKDEIARRILEEGEIQLTAEYRQKLRDAKRRQILTLLHRNGVDPRTHLPHPLTRLENALEEAKVKIDEFKSAEDQVKQVLEKLRLILPVKFETAELALKIPAEHASRCYSAVKNFSRIVKEEWQNDGSWVAQVEMPAGLRDEFLDELNKLTHGNVQAKMIKSR